MFNWITVYTLDIHTVYKEYLTGWYKLLRYTVLSCGIWLQRYRYTSQVYSPRYWLYMVYTVIATVQQSPTWYTPLIFMVYIAFTSTGWLYAWFPYV